MRNVSEIVLKAEEMFDLAFNLVERFADGVAAPLQLNMDERQTVDKDGQVVAGIVRSLALLVLVDDLQAVVVGCSILSNETII